VSAERSDSVALLKRALGRNDRAWNDLVRRFDEPLRTVVRDLTEAIHPLSDEQVDDLLGDFWLRVVDDDMRCLRFFRGATDDSLLAFLTMHVTQLAKEYLSKLRSEPVLVSLEEVKRVPQPPAPRRPAPSGRPADVAGLAALLALPDEVHALRAEVAGLRGAIDQLRRALPPALLSVGDTARALNVAPITVRRMIREGKLAHVRVGRSLRVDLTRTPIESVNASDGHREAVRIR
jgi:excisionase family DNA binding protein